MKLILLTTLVLCLIGCSDEKEAKNNSTLNQENKTQEEIAEETEVKFSELRAYLKPENQTFELSLDTGTTLVCEQGTVITIPKNTFVYADGNAVDGVVELSVKECYQLSDFIAEGLQTSSGNEMLETAGMVHLTAKCNGKEVKIAEGKTYEIKIPGQGELKQRMTAFYGNEPENGIVDWTLAPTNLNPNGLQSPMFRTNENLTNRSVASQPNQEVLNSGGEVVKMNTIVAWKRKGIHVPWGKTMTEWKLSTNDGQTLFSYIEDNFKPSESMIQEFFMSHRKPIYMLKFNEKGKLSNFEVLQSAGKENDQFIANFIADAPALSLEEMNDPRVHEFYHICFGPKIKKIRLNPEQYIEFMNEEVGASVSGEMSFYVMNLSKLGWINCDRFTNSNMEKMDFLVNVPNPDKTNVQLVFTEYASCMHGQRRGDQFVFEKIPKGVEVKVIAIQSNDEATGMAVELNKTGFGEVTIQDFESFTRKELADALNSI